MNAQHLTVLREMFAVCANERRMQEADALDYAIAALAAPKEAGPGLSKQVVAAILSEVLDEGDDSLSVGTFDEIVARLTAPSKEAGDGFVLVPREPTDSMHKAAWDACDNGMPMAKDWRQFNGKVYAAMLAAANPPGDQRQEGRHAWRPDADVECAVYCPRCDCTRRIADGAELEWTGCKASPPTEAAAAVGELPESIWRASLDGDLPEHVRGLLIRAYAALSPTASAAREGTVSRFMGDPDNQADVRAWLNANPDAEAEDGGRLG